MGKQLERKILADFFNDCLAHNDLFQEGRFDTCRARGARQCVVNEEFQRVRAMFVPGIIDLSNQFRNKSTIIKIIKLINFKS